MIEARREQVEKLRRLLASPDLEWVQQGLELLDALDDPALWAVFAAGLSVDGDGKVVIPEDSEVHATVAEAHRVGVALWALNRTGRLQEVTRLHLGGCRSLENVDVLEGCTNLTTLHLRDCDALPQHLQRKFSGRDEIQETIQVLQLSSPEAPLGVMGRLGRWLSS